MPKLIINGDDFGLSAENNAGIIAAYRNGGLTGTSLMMGGDAAQAAVELARQHPKLAVGLHVSLSDTKPVLCPELVPLLAYCRTATSRPMMPRIARRCGRGRGAANSVRR